jgi:hypothetical protein
MSLIIATFGAQGQGMKGSWQLAKTLNHRGHKRNTEENLFLPQICADERRF